MINSSFRALPSLDIPLGKVCQTSMQMDGVQKHAKGYCISEKHLKNRAYLFEVGSGVFDYMQKFIAIC